jgi:aspartyl/asparaginyl beta-hydroxylase (cupin superfamily)
MANIWYGIYREEYLGSEPAFFEVEKFDWASILTNYYSVILDELKPLMHENNTDLKSYFDENIQYPPKNWKTLGFYFWGKKNKKVCNRFPNTEKVLKQIPGLVSASFNMLEPHSHIKPHFGDTNAIFRAHLGIKIPSSLPECGFKVKNEYRSWENGKLLIFLDANVHEAFNNTSERRYILLIDVIRPEFEKQKISVCSHILAMLSLYYIISLNTFLVKISKHAPKIIINLFLYPTKLLWRIYFIFFKHA